MANTFQHSWHYQIIKSDNSFSLYFNDRLIAIYTIPPTGSWPLQATINDKMYTFSNKSLFQTSIQITDEITGKTLGVINNPFLSFIFSNVSISLANGEQYTWYSNNFFSLHWKWKKGEESIIDAIDNLSAKKHKGIIAIKEYKSGTDVLILAGFLLSLLKSGKIASGGRSLKRKSSSMLKNIHQG